MKCIIQSHRKSTIFLIFVLMLTHALCAQQTTAVVTGTVTNDKGDLMAGVSVNAANPASKEDYNTVTNERGIFTFSTMKLGSSYTFTATYVGYEPGVIRNFTVKQ